MVISHGKIKTATITFNNAVNWGARLQTYALQKSIISMGFNNEVINYNCPVIDDDYKAISLCRCKNVKNIIKMIIDFKNNKKRNYKFELFTKKNIKLTKMLNKDELKTIENKYDVFIAGSDQVFNYNLTYSDDAFLLGFSEDKKKNISYAGSFGINSIPNNKIEWYRKYFKNFLHVACREKTGAHLVKLICGTDAKVVLDPVFLLDATMWDTIIKYPKTNNDYIFVYMGSIELLRKAEYLAERYNLRIVNLLYGTTLRYREFSCENIYDVSPEEFLGYIKNARFVLTGSFHATAFSLIFHRLFLVEIPSKVGSRIMDLLKTFKLIDTIMTNDCIEPVAIYWKNVDRILENKRDESITYLKYMIEDSIAKQRDVQ